MPVHYSVSFHFREYVVALSRTLSDLVLALCDSTALSFVDQ